MSKEKKLTAFEWYIKEHNKIVKISNNLSLEARFSAFGDLIEKTKAMEKEQIIDAIDYYKKRPYCEMTPEQYYNEKYENK